VHIAHDDPRLSWDGAVSVEHGDGWTQPWRLPYSDIGLLDSGLVERASHGAGVRLRFATDATTISGEIDPIGVDPRPYGIKPLDLVIDGTVWGSADVQQTNRFEFVDLPSHMKTIELWLPHLWRFRLRELSVSDGARFESITDARPRWIIYGSSIEHCAEADRPTETWPAYVARSVGFNLLCLGFGAQCYLDTEVARTISTLSAERITLCLGINVQIGSAMTSRTFRSAVIGFVRLIREHQPRVPIDLVSPIYAEPREDVTNDAGMSVADARADVQAAAVVLREHGDVNVHYINGRDLIGPNDAALMADAIHPSAEGYRAFAERFRTINRLPHEN
jgi:lysophospholipase L1-like esterase